VTVGAEPARSLKKSSRILRRPSASANVMSITIDSMENPDAFELVPH
jgi:hypothetical protein